MPAKSLELRHTIHLIWELDAEIEEIGSSIQLIMNEIHSPITTVPGIGTRMGAMILAEVGNFSRFDSPDKILAYAGLANQLLCPYGEARLQISALCHLQRCQVRLPLGPNFRCVSR
jgi:transposase